MTAILLQWEKPRTGLGHCPVHLIETQENGNQVGNTYADVAVRASLNQYP